MYVLVQSSYRRPCGSHSSHRSRLTRSALGQEVKSHCISCSDNSLLVETQIATIINEGQLYVPLLHDLLEIPLRLCGQQIPEIIKRVCSFLAISCSWKLARLSTRLVCKGIWIDWVEFKYRDRKPLPNKRCSWNGGLCYSNVSIIVSFEKPKEDDDPSWRYFSYMTAKLFSLTYFRKQ